MQNYQVNSKQQSRPLMRSMIIPESNSQNKTTSVQTFYYNVRKMPNVSSSSQNYLQTYTTHDTSSYQHQHQKERNYETVRTPISNNKDLTILQLIDKVDKLNKIVEKHEHKLLTIPQKTQQQNISFQKNSQLVFQQTLNQLKKPNVLKQLFNATGLSHAYNAQVYEHIFNMKMDIQALKEQLSKTIKRKDMDNELLLSQQRIKQQINSNSIQYKKILKDLDDKIDKKTRSQSITLKSSMININSNEQNDISLSIAKLEQDINLIKSQLKIQFTISPIKCTLPPIMLKYQEVFRIKQHSNIIINQNLYYIDTQGNLLDHENRYILDLKGTNIKLEEKHLTMLKAVNIIK